LTLEDVLKQQPKRAAIDVETLVGESYITILLTMANALKIAGWTNNEILVWIKSFPDSSYSTLISKSLLVSDLEDDLDETIDIGEKDE